MDLHLGSGERGKEAVDFGGGCRCELRGKERDGATFLILQPFLTVAPVVQTAWHSWRQTEDVVFALSRKLNF